MQIPISKEKANSLYDILVAHAGANEKDRDDFVFHETMGLSEYRFIGALGFGGKFWNNNGFYINCYSEDKTLERSKIINKVNKLLKNI